MAINESVEFNTSPIKLGTTDLCIIWGTGAPDGDSAPEVDAVKGTIYIRTDASDDVSAFYQKIDEDGSDSDWAQLVANNDSTAFQMNGHWMWLTDKKIQFRDSAIYIYSPSDGNLRIVADTAVQVGDGTNQSSFASDGLLTMEGTAKVKKLIPLEISAGGGDCNIEAWNDGPTMNFDADAEVFYAKFTVPQDWDAASDLYWKAFVGNEIAEDDGDDVSFTLQVAAYADGEAASAAGQSVAVALDLTGGDEAINLVNLVSGTIDYDHGTYPLARGDVVQIKGTVNLGGAGECTGPLHICEHYIEYTSDRLGEAT